MHPYIRRRNGQEPVTYLHPLLENSLGKTLGVPLFQEQLMQMAIDVAGFTPAESDELRQAMGSKRSRGADGAAAGSGCTTGWPSGASPATIADELFVKMKAFANYGFPESHSVSFAYLVYASSWIKFHEPAAFCAALLNAQPMGFWSPHTLVQDARRHGVVVRTPDLNASLADGHAASRATDVRSAEVAVRLGIGSVRGIGADLAEEIEAGAAVRTVRDIEDLVRRVPALDAAAARGDGHRRAVRRVLRARAARGAVGGGAAVQSRPDRLPGIVTGADAPTPARHVRRWRRRSPTCGPPACRPTATRPCSCAIELDAARRRHRGRVCGRAEPRTRAGRRGRHPPPAADDRPGHDVPQPRGRDRADQRRRVEGCWAAHRVVAREAPAMLIRGRLERSEGVINIVAEHLAPLPVPASTASRDFR